MTFGEKLKLLRKEAGMSQENLAERVGISRQAVTKWESEQSFPSTENLLALAQVLDVPLSDLTDNKIEPEHSHNPILRSNLTLLAITLQAGMLYFCTQALDSAAPKSTGLQLWSVSLLLLCSAWMTSNLRFEPNRRQRANNGLIELAYCLVQLVVFFLTIRFSLGIVGLFLTITVLLIYILVINPRYMNRKFTK